MLPVGTADGSRAVDSCSALLAPISMLPVGTADGARAVDSGSALLAPISMLPVGTAEGAREADPDSLLQQFRLTQLDGDLLQRTGSVPREQQHKSEHSRRRQR
jgi:hypothetical protein